MFIQVNNPGHVTKMATMPIFVKTPSKLLHAIAKPIAMKHGM